MKLLVMLVSLNEPEIHAIHQFLSLQPCPYSVAKQAAGAGGVNLNVKPYITAHEQLLFISIATWQL